MTDGGDSPAPVPAELASTTSWRTMPGASVFQLRRLGYQLSRAPIVAITEDRCLFPTDWAKQVLAVHSAHPEAAAIGGSVENGATRSGLDWASLFLAQTPIAAPTVSGPATKIAGAVNEAYRREAPEPIDDFDGLGARIVPLVRFGRVVVVGSRKGSGGRSPGHGQ